MSTVGQFFQLTKGNNQAEVTLTFRFNNDPPSLVPFKVGLSLLHVLSKELQIYEGR